MQAPIQFPYEESILDLHDVALLLNYERASTEPRFRHAKLREVATTSDFKTVKILAPEWGQAAIPRTGFIFDKPKPKAHPTRPQARPSGSGAANSDPDSEEIVPDRDLPSTLLPTPTPPSLQSLSPTELETYFHQSRNHDGCFKTVALFQHFIDLFPSSSFTRVRVRTVGENNKPRNYTTLADDRLIIEMKLVKPRSLTMSCILPDNMTYITGGQPIMDHAVLGFMSPTSEDVDTILDLSSLQFGDVGRGYRGRGLFALEPVPQYLSRLDKYAKRHDYNQAKISKRIRGTPDDKWLRECAQRTKRRWENRAAEPWCGHCGAPPRGEPLKRCTKCQSAYYCDSEHQLAAWPFHKHFCVEPKPKKSQNPDP